MDIMGKITGIKYSVKNAEYLSEIPINGFDANLSPAFFLLKNNNNSLAVSKWVSPKRTRSYPYERVYNTLNISKKITIIPIVKDEGIDGDRDFLQWDTISLMSLLDVFVIFAYYEDAEKNPQYVNKITNQKFNNCFVLSKIKEIGQYHSSALHWNLDELKNNFHNLVNEVKKSYVEIEKNAGVKLHSFNGLDNFQKKIGDNVEKFMEFSRGKAQKAQSREINTIQPKESLQTLTKAKITITNYLGGQYFFTVDEVAIKKNTIYLIESKYSKNNVLPNKSDIKDGLLKMILYCNLCETSVNGEKIPSKAVLNLTSAKIIGEINSQSSREEKIKFCKNNDISLGNELFINNIFEEANTNNFILKIGGIK
jgi:hypothetical protein